MKSGGEIKGLKDTTSAAAAADAAKKVENPIARNGKQVIAPSFDDHDCNESVFINDKNEEVAWPFTMPGLTTDAVRNIVMLDGEICGEDAEMEVSDLNDWFVYDDNVTPENNGGGREWNYVAARPNAPRHGARDVCHADKFWTLSDSESFTVMNGSHKGDTVFIDDDDHADEQQFILNKLLAVKMPLMTNREIFYIGAGFKFLRDSFCGLSDTFRKPVLEALASKTPGFIKGEDDKLSEVIDGVMAITFAFANPKIPHEVKLAAYSEMAKVEGQDEWMRYWYTVDTQLIPGVVAYGALVKDNEDGKIEGDCATRKKEAQDLLNGAKKEFEVYDPSFLDEEGQLEFLFVWNTAIDQMLGGLDQIGCQKPVCGNKFMDAGEMCEKGVQTCAAGFFCKKCQCVEKGHDPVDPVEPVISDPVCGNNKIDSGEQCDGSDVGSCGNGCSSRCTCKAKKIEG